MMALPPAEASRQNRQIGYVMHVASVCNGAGGAAGIRVLAGAYSKPMSIPFDQTDFSVVVKNRAPPPRPWRWEIYRAGRNSPIECAPVFYETVEAATRAGKKA